MGIDISNVNRSNNSNQDGALQQKLDASINVPIVGFESYKFCGLSADKTIEGYTSLGLPDESVMQHEFPF